MNNFIKKAAAVLMASAVICTNMGVLCQSVQATSITINERSTASPSASSSPSSSSSPAAEDENDETTESVPPIQTIPPITASTSGNDDSNTGFFGTKVSRGGLYVWSIFIILINLIISFMIGNRFYRLAKKDNRVQAEIRALRRDIDEKMVAHVSNIQEKTTTVSSDNPDYSKGAKSIRVNIGDDNIPEEARDILAKWEAHIAANEPQQTAEPRVEREITPEMRASRNASKSNARKTAARRDYEEEYPEEENSGGTVKQKVKDLIDDIFPFGE